jgi:hypothetical protein
MRGISFMMITASPEVAAFVEMNGVSRIFMDQEVIGKAERQGHLDTHQAFHSLNEITAVAQVLKKAELMVRINPLHSGTLQEINAALIHGAQRLMLPMFTNRNEVACFLKMVSGRAPVTFLVETPQALVRLADWITLLTPRYDEVHFGLNDLSLGMGLNFLFEPMAAKLFDPSAELLNRAGIAWGVGGIARIGEGELPAETILGEHVRLGSQWVILSRAFHGGAAKISEMQNFNDEIRKLRNIEWYWYQAGTEELENNHRVLATIVYNHLGNSYQNSLESQDLSRNETSCARAK